MNYKNAKERKNKSKIGVYLVCFGENESNVVGRNQVTLNQQPLL